MRAVLIDGSHRPSEARDGVMVVEVDAHTEGATVGRDGVREARDELTERARPRPPRGACSERLAQRGQRALERDEHVLADERHDLRSQLARLDRLEPAQTGCPHRGRVLLLERPTAREHRAQHRPRAEATVAHLGRDAAHRLERVAQRAGDDDEPVPERADSLGRDALASPERALHLLGSGDQTIEPPALVRREIDRRGVAQLLREPLHVRGRHADAVEVRTEPDGCLPHRRLSFFPVWRRTERRRAD